MKINISKIIIMFSAIILLTGCTVPSHTIQNDRISETEAITVSSNTESTTNFVPESEDTSEAETSEPEIAVSDFNELPDDIKGTIIPIDSLLLYHTETGKEYDSNDTYMLWRTLQYAFGNFGVNYNRAEMKDYSLCVEPIIIGEFTTAILDGDYKNYPIPEELNDQAWYDSNDNLYYFGVGDRGLSQTEILTYQYLDNHNLKVTARLYGLDDNSTICSGTFYFKRNDYASGVIEPLFYFTVTDAEYANE